MLWTPFFVFTAWRGYPIPAGALLISAAVAAAIALALGLVCGRAGAKRQAVVFALLVAIVLDIQFDWFRSAAAYAAIAVLLVLFWALRQHIASILIAMFGAVLASTLVLGALQPYQEVRVAEAPSGAARSAAEKPPGRIIHLLLDEYAGIQGIPADIEGGEALRQEQQAFFPANGFRLFGNAISEYEASRNSISGILNFTAGPTPYDRYHGSSPFVLNQSRYFEALTAAGYDLRIYQSTYMDYCGASGITVARCTTYRYDGTGWLKTSGLDQVEQLKVLFSLYLNRSDIAEAVMKVYLRLDQRLQERGLRLPPLPEWDDSPSSVNAMAMLERVSEDAISGPDGTAYFAHLLIPHGPYAYERDCRLRGDFSSWRSNHPPYRKASSEDERQTRYRAYFEQLRCMQVKLQQLFDGLKAAGHFEDAIIIVHGDHGSRIHVVPARAENLGRLQERDYLDGFATLFAAKSPALEGGYDAETAPVSQLLAQALGRSDLILEDGEPLQVYLEGEDDDEPWAPVLWPLMP